MALVHKVGWDPDFLRRSPWFWPLTEAAGWLGSRASWPSLEDFDALYAALTRGLDVPPLRFGQNVRRQDKRIEGRVNLDALYDARIARHGQVPSREHDWHDFFNALCFATFPRAKRALHARQHVILTERVTPDATRLPGARTREQDALTLFDEGGVVLAADARAHAQLSALGPADRRLAAEQIVAAAREASEPCFDFASGRVAVVPFGHALFEHLIEGLRCPGGCSQLVGLPTLPQAPGALLRVVDATLAATLADRARFADPAQCGHLLLSLR